MASLLRSPAIRRALPAASSGCLQGLPSAVLPQWQPSCLGERGGAAVPRDLGLPTMPRRHLSPPGGEPPNTTSNQIDRNLRQAKEVEQLVQISVNELMELYTEMRTGDHGYFERVLSKCGIPRSKLRDDFVLGCKLAAIFTASGVLAHLLPDI